MPITRKLPSLPVPSTPVLDQNGIMTREWYRFLSDLIAVLEEMRSAL